MVAITVGASLEDRPVRKGSMEDGFVGKWVDWIGCVAQNVVRKQNNVSGCE